MRMDSSITVGELLANPVTAPVIRGMMGQMAGAGPVDFSEPDPMMEAMMRFMPLKSLISFGMLDHEKMENLLSVLKAAVEKA